MFIIRNYELGIALGTDAEDLSIPHLVLQDPAFGWLRVIIAREAQSSVQCGAWQNPVPRLASIRSHVTLSRDVVTA